MDFLRTDGVRPRSPLNGSAHVRAPAPIWLRVEQGRCNLIGTRCIDCGTVHFPRSDLACRNPRCRSRDLREVALSSQGELWSHTFLHFRPTAMPHAAGRPNGPLGFAAVALREEQIVILGTLSNEEDAELSIGVPMVLDSDLPEGSYPAIAARWTWRAVAA